MIIYLQWKSAFKKLQFCVIFEKLWINVLFIFLNIQIELLFCSQIWKLVQLRKNIL